MKLGFSTKICPEYSLEEINNLAEKTGFEYIEFQVGREQNHELDNLVNDNSESREIKELLSGLKIKPWVLATSVKLNQKALDNFEEVEKTLIKWVEVAVDINVKYLRIFPSHAELNKEDIVKMLKMASDAVKDYPVDLLLETHGYISKGKDIKEVLDKADTDNMFAIWDIAHTTVNCETVSEAYEYISPYLKHVHIKDFAKVKEEDPDNPYDAWKRFVPFGEGDFPLEGLFNVLKNNDYQGVVSVEINAEYASAEEYLMGAKELI